MLREKSVMLKRPFNFLDAKDLNEDAPIEVPIEPKRRSYRKLVLTALVIVTAFFAFRVILRKQQEAYGMTLTPKSVSFMQTVRNFIFKPSNILEGQKQDRINILLLGIGGPGHDGPYLSDTNIIVSIKPSTNEVALVSIPRDLGVQMEYYGWQKINHVNAVGELKSPGLGGEYARQVFEHTFNQKIPYYIRVDFKAFEEIIDSLGGINVNVPNSFTDNAFPGPNFSYRTVHFDKGPQTMNGEKALSYARSRHGNNGEGSDFARARRQQIILETLKDKILSAGTLANPAQLESIYKSLNTHVSTNLNFAQLIYLANMGKNIGETKSLVLDNSPNGFLVSTTGDSGAFLLSPKTGNFDTINFAINNIFESTTSTEFVNQIKSVHSSAVSSTAKIEVENGTWIPGLAARIEKKITENGFNVISVGNSFKKPISYTTIYILSPSVDPLSIKYLSKLLSAASATTLPEWLKEEYDNPSTPEDESGMKYNKDADILIILGTDTKE